MKTGRQSKPSARNLSKTGPAISHSARSRRNASGFVEVSGHFLPENLTKFCGKATEPLCLIRSSERTASPILPIMCSSQSTLFWRAGRMTQSKKSPSRFFRRTLIFSRSLTAETNWTVCTGGVRKRAPQNALKSQKQSRELFRRHRPPHKMRQSRFWRIYHSHCQGYLGVYPSLFVLSKSACACA